MTTVSFKCPVCNHQFNVQENNNVICPSCKTFMKVLKEKDNKKINIELNYTLPEKEPYEGKATQKQKQKIWDLGFKDQTIIDNLGKKQASALIDQLINAIKQEHRKRTNLKQLIIFGLIIVIVILFWLFNKFGDQIK